jgi:dephospho-CoA kinase
MEDSFFAEPEDGLLRVALTGNIASGKTTVAETWRELGARVVEADVLARRAVAPGTSGLERIVARWGPGILLPTGELDRAALRDVVFRDASERTHLEEIVHPEVNRLRYEELRKAEEEGLRILVSDIPLLFEAGLQNDHDLVVLVDAPEAVRKERLVRERGLDPDEAQRMIDSQWPVDRKRPGSDFVIENRGSREQLQQEARRIWEMLVGRTQSRL